MATFPAAPKPQFISSYSVGWKTLITTFESGKEQRRAKWGSSKTMFTLVFNALTKANAETLRDFHIARQGSFESFSYVNPMETGTPTYTVRFLDDGFSVDSLDGSNCSVKCEFIEVL
ncbi:MAG: DUF2460 domain-containing protein [Spirochaetes bacterium]|nr:DUF2460 domain-containing protein [Spirochaetota bacterium]